MALFQAPVRWNKLGLVITPRPSLWWMRTHAMIPTVEPLGGTEFKIYFSGRDDDNRSHIGWAILDLAGKNPRVVDFAAEPVLTLGALGAFDDNGVTPSCLINHGGRKLLYYIGWNKGATVRMLLFGGLAISEDGGRTFQRYSRAPILERTNGDPFLNTAPFVVHDNGVWRMYYVGGTEWVHKDLPRYNIKYATSADGLTWRRDGHVAIDFGGPREHALARPMVMKDGETYRMWFSFKNEDLGNYRIGYAESENAVDWTRADHLAGIAASQSGWDSEMIEYGHVFECRGTKYLVYNGNNYGHGGIGLAVAT